MSRSTMADLITRTRTLIADPAAVTFTDQQVQDALDLHREERRWVALRPMPTYGPGGIITYLDYYSDTGNWEADVVLQDLTYTVLSPTGSEYIVGHWTFTVQPTGIGVRATGKTYDIYNAAADLLENWAALVKLDFSFSSDAENFQRAGKYTMIVDLAQKYRAQALPHIARLVQSDAAPDHDGAGVTYPRIRGGDE